MRFEIGEGCVALRSLGIGSRGSSFTKAHYKLSASILWTASFLLSRVLLGRWGG